MSKLNAQQMREKLLAEVPGLSNAVETVKDLNFANPVAHFERLWHLQPEDSIEVMWNGNGANALWIAFRNAAAEKKFFSKIQSVLKKSDIFWWPQPAKDCTCIVYSCGYPVE